MRALPEISEREFAFSQAWDRKRLTLLLVLVPFLFLWTFGFALVLTGSNVAESLGLVRTVFVAMVFIFAVELPLLSRLSRTQRVLLFEDRLVRESGRKREPIHWEEITRVERIEDREGRVVTLRLYTAGRRGIDVGGFKDMESLDGFIRTKLAATLYRTRRLQPNLKYLVRMVVQGTGIMAAYSVLFLTGILFDVLPFALASFGPYLFMVRPMTRLDPRFGWFEIAFGVFFLLGGFFLGYMAYRFRFT